MTTIASNILVVGPAWVGDMIMAQSLFIKLKQTRPQCRIMVTAPDSTLPLLKLILSDEFLINSWLISVLKLMVYFVKSTD